MWGPCKTSHVQEEFVNNGMSLRKTFAFAAFRKLLGLIFLNVQLMYASFEVLIYSDFWVTRKAIIDWHIFGFMVMRK